MWRINHFVSYLVFYVPRRDGITVERIIHAKQDYGRFFEPD